MATRFLSRPFLNTTRQYVDTVSITALPGAPETYKFNYYTDGSDTPRTNGNAYVICREYPDDPGQYETAYFTMLKSVELPTGGRIEIDYQLYGITYRIEEISTPWEGDPKYADTTRLQFFDGHFGAREVRYYDSLNSTAPDETRRYTMLLGPDENNEYAAGDLMGSAETVESVLFLSPRLNARATACAAATW